MARGNLPTQTPQVPEDVFLPLDMIYQYVKQLNVDVGTLEGSMLKQDAVYVSTTSLVGVRALSFPMRGLARFKVKGMVFVTSNIKLRHAGPVGPDRIMLRWDKLELPASASNGLDAAYSSSDIALAGGGFYGFEGLVYNGAVPGYFEIQAAQNASNVTPSRVLSGSWIQYSPID